MDDIKRALEAIYAVKEETQPVSELASEPKGAQAAVAHMGKETEIKGTFNAKMFGGLLGMDSSEASMLASFLAKHKKGMPPGRNELLAAADAFRALVDADPQVTNQAMMMLRRVSAAEAIEMESAEEVVETDEIEQAVGEIAEGIRVTKEGVEECWNDMPANSPIVAGGDQEAMTVNITTPNKQISVTTDSAAEIMNVLKLAGIDAGAAMGDVDGDGDHDMDDHKAEQGEPAMVGAAPIAVIQAPDSEGGEGSGDEEAKEDDSEEDKKEESVEVNEPAVDENAYNMAAAAAAREGKDEFEFPEGSGKMHPVKMKKDTAHAMGESEESVEEGRNEAARILALAGLDESKLANSPAGTSMDEPMEADELPSMPGEGAGHSDFGQNRANGQGENPMGVHSSDMKETFEIAMGEYRKFVAEHLGSKDGVKKV